MTAMPLRSRGYAHVDIDQRGGAIVTGTTMKVVELIEAQRANGWSPEELHFQFPHITLGQIYSALAYYWDHQDELDAQIAERSRRADEARVALNQTAIGRRLREQGLLE